MTRPTSVKPDNFFLLLYRALRQRRVPIALRIAVHSLLLVTAALLIYAWVMGMQFRQAMQQQADALGESLTIQTADSARDLLVANDILSLNVLLNNLIQNPLVAHAAIYSVDNNRVLAEAGTRPKQSLLGDLGVYSTPITFQEVIAGQLRVSLDMQQFQQPMMISLQSMGLISLILLLLTLILSLRLGRQISTPLLQLRIWLRDPDDPAPGSSLQNEIGDLARQLQSRLVVEAPPQLEALDVPKLEEVFDENLLDEAPEEAFGEPLNPLESLPELPPEPISSGSSAVLAVQLGAQEQLRRLPRSRLVDLLERYRGCLQQAARLYKGELHTQDDGSSLIFFHSREQLDDYLTSALCCGELLRALGHALQIEVADSGIALQLQLGLTLAEDIADLEVTEGLKVPAVQAALALSQHSRNLLLVERGIGDNPQVREQARIRPIASPEDTCCVEWLNEPYPSIIERQLSRMRALRGA